MENGWARLITDSGVSGWASADLYGNQSREPLGKTEWIAQKATLLREATLLRTPGGEAREEGTLPAGTALTVTKTEDGFCLVHNDALCGWLPVDSLQLSLPEDGGEVPESLRSAAAAALGKAFPEFSGWDPACLGEALDSLTGYEGPLWRLCFTDGENRLLYTALVRTEDEKVLFTQDCTGFGYFKEEEIPLETGEAELTLDSDTIALGERVLVTLRAWTDVSCRWTLLKDGEALFTGKDETHFSAAFRPTEEGSYTIRAEITDENGLEVTREAELTVTSGSTAVAEAVYSQKDGWWADKQYRKSDLEQSGCAIFALSHALQRMGYTGDEILPENLAVTYALCLTSDGTNNGRLISEAAADFGFTTRKTLYESEKQIVSLLQEGCLFSFSVARGHIALIDGVTEDGKYVHVVDSAPSATAERIVGASLYYKGRSGALIPAATPGDIPGAEWYPANDQYGGLEYYLPTSYAAKRGVRLIRPAE